MLTTGERHTRKGYHNTKRGKHSREGERRGKKTIEENSVKFNESKGQRSHVGTYRTQKRS